MALLTRPRLRYSDKRKGQAPDPKPPAAELAGLSITTVENLKATRAGVAERVSRMLKSKDPKVRPDLDNVPQDMAEAKAWAPWASELDVKHSKQGDEVYKKVAKRLDGKGNLRDNSEGAAGGWGTLAEAKAAYDPKKHAGIAFMLRHNPVDAAVLDIDLKDGHDLKDVAKASPAIKELMAAGTLEKSPSGNGAHVWFKGRYPVDRIGQHLARTRQGIVNADGEKVAIIEMYDAQDFRYMTFTGKTYGSNHFNALRDASEAAKGLANVITRKDVKTPHTASESLAGDAQPTKLQVLDKISHSKQADEFNLLYHKDAAKVASYLKDGEHGQNSADQALMNMLAFWTGKDSKLMDDIFRDSELMRPKWDEKRGRQTYGQRTIQVALDGTAEAYNWRTHTVEKSQQAPATPAQTVGQELAEQRAKDAARAYIGTLDLDNITLTDLKTGTEQYLTQDELDKLLMNTSGATQAAALMKKVSAKADTPAIPTGYKYLDAELDGGLYPGLYVLGAISSLGKTTFMLQIADQIAAGNAKDGEPWNGHDVLLFSLEMSRFEINAKSLSRLTFQEAMADHQAGKTNKTADAPENAAKTTRGITDGRRRNGFTDVYGKVYKPYTVYEKTLIERASLDYQAHAGQHIFIEEGVGNIGATEIRAKAIEYRAALARAHGVKPEDYPTPVIMVDYLQIMAPADPHSTDKQNTDKAVLELKRLSRDLKTPVFTISSFNRENYSQAVSMQSFKESGAVEYSSDVLLGLQVQGMEAGATDKSRAVNRERVDEVKSLDKTPRPLELKVLKNRNGKTGGSLYFKYWSLFNDYIECRNKTADSEWKAPEPRKIAGIEVYQDKGIKNGTVKNGGALVVDPETGRVTRASDHDDNTF